MVLEHMSWIISRGQISKKLPHTVNHVQQFTMKQEYTLEGKLVGQFLGFYSKNMKNN